MADSGRGRQPRVPAAATRAISRPGDVEERSADAFAARIARPASTPLPSHSAVAAGASPSAAIDHIRTPATVDDELASTGHPLDQATRSFMERGLGHDLGRVRIHAGPRAAQAARSLRAVAFTSGSDVVLGAGAPALSSARGRELLAHELTHVVQAGPAAADTTLRRDVAASLAVEPGVEEPQAAQVAQQDLATAPAGASVVSIAQKERIHDRLRAFVASAENQSDEEMGTQVAEYLVVTEKLRGADLDALLSELQNEDPVLMQAAAFAGWLFVCLRRLNVAELATSAGWYVAITLRDVVAGDFVEDPTALAIVLRTLLTLIPGLDTAADVEDLAANLLYGVLDPATKLVSVGWWFTVGLSLVGLFPAFGSAIKGVVKLVLKGLGDVALAGLEAAFRMLPSGPKVLETGLEAVTELLAKADSWRPWAIAKFIEGLDLLIGHLSGLPAALLSKAATVLATLNEMKRFAADSLPKALAEIQRLAQEALNYLTKRLGIAAPKAIEKGTEEIAEEVTEELTEEVTEELTEEVTEELTEEVTEEIPKVGPDDVTEKLPGETTDELLEETTEKATDDLTRKQAKAKKELEDAALRALPHEGKAISLALRKLTKAGFDADTLDRIRNMTDAVVNAFAKPAEFAEAARLILEHRRQITGIEIKAELDELKELKRIAPGLGTDLTDEAAAYIAAVKKLAGDRGVVEIHKKSPTEVWLIRRDGQGRRIGVPKILPAKDGFVPDDIFMREVIQRGEAILDFAVLEQGAGEHGVITHVLHDLVADKALRASRIEGASAAAYRQLMGTVQNGLKGKMVVDLEFLRGGIPQRYEPGTILWVGTYDRVRSLAQPETLWPPLRQILGLAPKEL